MKITRFEDIEAWQLARHLTRRIYRLAKEPKFAKDYGLRDQSSRASVSVMANIAEGFNSGSNAEFVRFLGYAQRSCAELHSHLYVALDQNYLMETEFKEIYELVSITSSKIGAFIKYLKQFKTKNEERRTKNEEQ